MQRRAFDLVVNQGLSVTEAAERTGKQPSAITKLLKKYAAHQIDHFAAATAVGRRWITARPLQLSIIENA